VRLPVEVVAQRAELVVEGGQLVAQIVDDRDRVVERLRLLMRGVGAGPLQRQLLAQNVDGVGDLVGLPQQILAARLLVAEVHDLTGALRAHLERDRAVADRRAQRPGDRLHQRDALGVQHALGDAFEHEHVGGGAHVVVGLDHQQFGIQPGFGEVPRGGGVTLDGRCRVGQIRARVVVRLVSGQNQHTDHGEQRRHRQDRPRPAHDRRSDPPPTPLAGSAFRFHQAEPGGD
jgi:hypothetical protein